MKKLFKKNWVAWTCTLIVIASGVYGAIWLTIHHLQIVFGMGLFGSLIYVSADTLAKPIGVIPWRRARIRQSPQRTAAAA